MPKNCKKSCNPCFNPCFNPCPQFPIPGPTGARGPTGATGPAGATGETGATGAPATGGSAILKYSSVGPLTTGQLNPPGFTLGFGNNLAFVGSTAVAPVQGITGPGVIYFRAPRAGTLQNLYVSFHAIATTPIATTLTLEFVVFTAPGPDGAVPPVFTESILELGASIDPTGPGEVFVAFSDTIDTVAVNAGDYIAVLVRNTEVSSTLQFSIATIEAGIEFI